MINRVAPVAAKPYGSHLPLALLFVACASHPPGQTPNLKPSQGITRAVPPPLPTTTPTPSALATAASTATSATAPSPDDEGTPCGALDCRTFDNAESALLYLLKKTDAVVLAVGEIHAQKGNTLKATPPQRFARLLPLFHGRARHLVIELWTGRNDCGDDRVAQVKEAQKPVVQAQSATNQNDYLELGTQAKAQGVFPHALVPTCEDYKTILAAKSDDITKMLELTAVKTQALVESLLQPPAGGNRAPLIITYGGALHNDVNPKPGRETWSFGPALTRATDGHFVELDIVLREQVRDTESFTTLPFYPYFRKGTLEQHYVLFRPGNASYTLVFPAERYLP